MKKHIQNIAFEYINKANAFMLTSMIVVSSSLMSQNAYALFGLGGVTGGATEFTQYANFALNLKKYAVQIKEYVNMVNQLANEIKQYENMIKNTVNLPNVLWDKVARPISSIVKTYGRTRNMLKNMLNEDNAIRNIYKNYDFFKLRNQSIDEYFQNYSNWNASNTKMYNRLMDMMGEQANNLDDETDVLDALLAKNKDDIGQKEALQIANEFAGSMVHQMQELRKLIMGQIQMETAYKAKMEQIEAAQKAQAYAMEHNAFKGVIVGDERKY